MTKTSKSGPVDFCVCLWCATPILGTRSGDFCLFVLVLHFCHIKHIKPGPESQNRRFLESYIPKVLKWPQLSGISSLALLSSPVRPSCVAARLLGTLALLCRNQTVFLFASQAMKGCLAVRKVSYPGIDYIRGTCRKHAPFLTWNRSSPRRPLLALPTYVYRVKIYPGHAMKWWTFNDIQLHHTAPEDWH